MASSIHACLLVGFVIFSSETLTLSALPLAATNSTRLSEIMTGLLLGDASLVKKYAGGGTYFKYAQGNVHVGYVHHVFELFKALGLVHMPTPHHGTSTGPNGIVYDWWQFTTASFVSWNSLRTLWYPQNIKVVPDNISELLTPVSLAYWYIDDGGWTGKGIHLATNGFILADVKRLVTIISSQYGLKCSVHSRNRVYIWASSTPKFINLVRPHIHSSISYKLSPRTV